MDAMHNNANEKLFRAILSLETTEECDRFLEDLCTIKELEAISQRLAVAEMLYKGANYMEISAQTGASTATISRVNRCLSYGGGGYKTVLSRLAKEDTK